MRFASSRWVADVNSFDFCIGKPHYLTTKVISTPLFGINALWIHQNYFVRYFINKIKNVVTHKNDFSGLGIKGSLLTEFLLNKNFVIFTKNGFALLNGKFDTNQRAKLFTPNNNVNYEVSDSYYRITSNLEMSIGFKWGRFFNKNQYLASLVAIYEFHKFLQQNQLRRFYHQNPSATDKVSNGNLYLSGFIIGVNLDF